MKRKLFSIIPIALYSENTLTATEKLVLTEIQSLDVNGGCSASDQFLGNIFGISVKRMQKLLISLRKKGWIQTIDFDGRKRILKINPGKWEDLERKSIGNWIPDFPDNLELDTTDLGGADPANLGGADPANLGGADPANLGGADPANLGGADPANLGGPCKAIPYIRKAFNIDHNIDHSLDQFKKHPPNPPEGDLPCATEIGAGKIRVTEKQVEEIYLAYPRKEGKAKACEKIRLALRKVSYDELLRAVQEYAASRYVKTAPLKFIPMPQTWFHQERWLDDRTCWNRSFEEEKKPPSLRDTCLDKANQEASKEKYRGSLGTTWDLGKEGEPDPYLEEFAKGKK